MSRHKGKQFGVPYQPKGKGENPRLLVVIAQPKALLWRHCGNAIEESALLSVHDF